MILNLIKIFYIIGRTAFWFYLFCRNILRDLKLFVRINSKSDRIYNLPCEEKALTRNLLKEYFSSFQSTLIEKTANTLEIKTNSDVSLLKP